MKNEESLIWKRRTLCGLTMREAAQRSGVDIKTMVAIENNPASQDDIAKLKKVYDDIIENEDLRIDKKTASYIAGVIIDHYDMDYIKKYLVIMDLLKEWDIVKNS